MNEQLAQTYEQVFAGTPWNEYKRCTGRDCGKSFGLETRGVDMCPCPKEAMLAPFYPREETLQAIEKETEQPNAVVDIKRDENGRIIGFVWGYPTTVVSFVENKYKTKGMRDAVIDTLKDQGIVDNFFYFSETGIIPEYRGRGYSNEFAQKMVAAAQEAELPLVMRTNWQSPMVAVAEKFGMRQVLGPEVFLVNKHLYKPNGVVSQLDRENPDRVLFIKPFVRKI